MTLKVEIVGLLHMELLHLRNTRFIDGIKLVAATDKSQREFKELARSMFQL